MQLELQKHEKVRFRRDEICDLGAFPSAVGKQVPRVARKPVLGRAMRTAAKSIAGLLMVFAAIVAAAYGLGASGIGTERLRVEAEAALRRVAGPDMAVAVGPARISPDGARFLALNISDLRISSFGMPAIEAGNLQFGVRALPLLGGNLKLGSAKISDARINVATLLLNRTGDWTAGLRNEDGLIDPDLAGAALFDVLHSAFDTLARGGTRRIDLERTELILAEKGRIRSLLIAQASLADAGDGTLALSAEGSLDGRQLSLVGTARGDGSSDRIADLSLSLTVAPAEALVLNASGLLSEDGSKSRLGAAEIRITGSEGVDTRPTSLAVAIKLDDSIIDMGKRGVVPLDADADATLLIGANKVEFNQLRLTTGRTEFDMTGAVGPQPRAADSNGQPTYRYEFVTDRAVLSPVDSPESPISFSARVAGRFNEQTRLLSADEVAIRTGQGELVGVASAEFAPGKTPGLALALSASDMPVAQVKQFWPWLAAGRARQWALGNFFGGTVVDSQVRYRVAPGRIGDGVPLNENEISGRFEVVDSRFDTTGSLPPIRDAAGVIEFRGNDVDVALTSGNAYMPSGKRVAVSNGKLTFRNAHVQPVIGDLDLDIQGDATAVAELASFEPINAMRRLNLSPADFSGSVTGHIKSQLPLAKSTPLSSIEWLVSLNVSNLAVSKPFDGQKVTAADGRIIVDPRHAEVSADAMLNGIPAKLRIVEPLKEDGPARVREVDLTVDDKRRRQMAPGLDGLVSGAMVLKVDASVKDAPQSVEADLSRATLTLPWVGWSKGAGVPAKVSFGMKRDGSATTLSNFELDGESFAISGDLKLADGSLSSARLDKVRLNRGDSARVDISRQGRAYSVAINGAAFDARALVKLILGESDGKAAASESPAVTVKAAIDKLTGFKGETLSNFKLSYSGRAGGQASYSASGVTDRGGAVTVANDVEGDQQVMRVQAADAGSFVRFLDIYENMQGGEVNLTLRGQGRGAMRGQVDATNFDIVNEARLGSIVATRPAGSDRSLNQAVRRDIDTSRVQFQRGYAAIEKGSGYLSIADGILRGPTIGASFQGMLYDKRGNIDMTGTFMPAYGLNRIFGELPIIGVLLGNGRDRGLIGVTFKLGGKASKPQLQVNPLSVIAPGIFRQIFEFR